MSVAKDENARLTTEREKANNTIFGSNVSVAFNLSSSSDKLLFSRYSMTSTGPLSPATT
jgi:hypothetical protein